MVGEKYLVVNLDFAQGQENPPLCQRFATYRTRLLTKFLTPGLISLSLYKVVVDSHNLSLMKINGKLTLILRINKLFENVMTKVP